MNLYSSWMFFVSKVCAFETLIAACLVSNQDAIKASIAQPIDTEIYRLERLQALSTNQETNTNYQGLNTVLYSNILDTSATSSPKQKSLSFRFKQALLSLQNPRLFSGDIVLLPNRVSKFSKGRNNTSRTDNRNGKTHSIKFARAALASDARLWPDGVIYYVLDESVLHIAELIFKAMSQFHRNTCIRFEPRPNEKPDYIKIEAIKGCFSYIGRTGGEQSLSLEGRGCEYPSTIVHELMHVVGFYHQQNRSDRDEFIDIVWDNVSPDYVTNFSRMSPEEHRLIGKFDYDSIMLYGPKTFGKTFESETMRAKTSGIKLKEILEKPGLSAIDISSINKLYQCYEDNDDDDDDTNE